MRKDELGLIRSNKIGELKDKYKELCSIYQQGKGLLEQLGIKNFELPKRISNLYDIIINAIEGNEFMDKEGYSNAVREIQAIDKIEDDINKLYRPIFDDFGNFSLFGFTSIFINMLEVGTYDVLLNEEYPCTCEFIVENEFTYYEADAPDVEINLTSPEEMWNFLKENYDSIEE